MPRPTASARAPSSTASSSR